MPAKNYSDTSTFMKSNMNSGNNLIEGKYKFSDIVSINRLTDIFSKFSKATGFTIGLVDNNSLEVLIKTGWHDICVNFHRADEKACEVCKKSNKILFKNLNQEKSVRIVECEHGLYDCATPIMIEGKHVANLVTGQLLMQEPDIKQFEKQADIFNFNKQKYLEALSKVPIVGKKDVAEMMDYLAELSSYIAEKGLEKLRINKLNEELLEAKEKSEESEIQLKEAQQIAHLGHWELDLVNDKLIWSDEIYRIFNLKPQEFGATYKAFLENIHPDDRNKVNEAYTGSLRNKTPYEIEHRLLLKTGELKYVLEKCNTEFDKHGNPIRSMGTVLDITHLKKTEKELIKAKEKAEESDRLKSAFLANMSHEVRTPLNAVLGFSNLLRRENISKEKKEEIIGHISDGCNSMFIIISDIIDVSKIDADQLSINKDEFNLNLLLNKLQNQFSVSNTNKKISVRAKILLDDRGCNIITDETRVNQILSNLIENALKFTNEGSIEFGYDIKANIIQFYVKDTGIGINPEHHKLIFERFRQVDDNYSGLGRGAGLGLSIVKGLLALLKGEIWVESEINKGTTFHFTIPYIPAEQEKNTSGFENDFKFEMGDGVTILIAEDDLLNFTYLKLLLENYNYNILHAKNGKEAVEFVSTNNSIDLVLMDTRMPVMNGLEATEKIRETNKTIPIIAQTAYVMAEDRMKAKKAGYNDYISKPISVEMLSEIIKKHIKKSANSRSKPGVTMQGSTDIFA